MRSRRFAAGDGDSDVAESIAAFAGRALRRDEDRIVDAIVAVVRTEVRGLAVVPDKTIEKCVRTDFRRAMGAIAERRLPTDRELASSGAAAVKLTQAGVAIGTVLRARRVAIRRAGELMRELGADAGLTADAQVESIHRLWEWADAIQVGDAEAHRAAELETRDSADEERTWFVSALLNGTLSAAEIAGRASAYGLLPGAVYRAFRARPAPGAEIRALARVIEATGSEGSFGVLMAKAEGDLRGALIVRPRVDGLGVVGLGPACELARLDVSFRLADRALETALAFGYDGVVTMDDLSLRPAIMAEGHLGERMVHRYLDPLHELGEFGATLENTVREYLSHGMRIDESAKALFVHPNTLRHRLDRFRQITGADLRRTEDVLELWWALQRRRLDAAAEPSGQ